jgi:hypothetical protein
MRGMAVALLLGGCINVGIDSNAQSTLHFELGALDGQCGGGNDLRDANGDGTTYTETIDGDNCRIDATWQGQLLDLQSVRDTVASEAKKNNTSADKLDLTIHSVVLDLSNVALVDSAGVNIAPPTVPAWKAEITLDNDAIFDLSGKDVTSLFAGDTQVALSKECVALLDKEYHSGQPVKAAGTASLSVAMSDLPSLAGKNPTISFDLAAQINGTAQVKP